MAPILAIVALGPACRASSRSTTLRSPLPPRPDDAPLAIYLGAERPPCPYDELAAIEAGSSAPDVAAMERAKRQARASGADALIVLGARDVGGGEQLWNVVLAVAVRTRCPNGGAPRPVWGPT